MRQKAFKGAKPLFKAAQNDRIAGVMLLLDKDAKPPAIEIEGITALAVARANRYKAIIKLLGEKLKARPSTAFNDAENY